jgi:hypothetical protein
VWSSTRSRSWSNRLNPGPQYFTFLTQRFSPSVEPLEAPVVGRFKISVRYDARVVPSDRISATSSAGQPLIALSNTIAALA